MRKLITLILTAAMLLTFFIPAAAADSVISIKTLEDLKAIVKEPEASYRLDADIDMGGADWTPIPFYGILDGNDHVLYNLRITAPGKDTAVTVDGNNKQYDTRFAALFSVTRNAEIRDLNLIGAQVSVETDNHCFAAILAG